MRPQPIVLAAAVTLGLAALFAATLASGTEALGKQEKLECTACHDKPGSKLLTDQGKYYETRRTLDGYADLKATFGRCTHCHVSKPGSQKLTKEGKRFQEMVRDMAGLGEWMQQHHPAPAPPPAKEPAPKG